MGDQKRVKLSKAILDMKFMKKTKEREEKIADDAEGYAMYSNEMTEEMRKKGTIVFVDASISQCKNLIEGRLSYGGMNPEVEKIMASTLAKKMEEIEKAKEKDISDAELAQGYSTLVDTMGKKFQPKSNRPNLVSKKFISPDVN